MSLWECDCDHCKAWRQLTELGAFVKIAQDSESDSEELRRRLDDYIEARPELHALVSGAPELDDVVERLTAELDAGDDDGSPTIH